MRVQICVPERGTAAAVLQANVTMAGLVLHGLVPHAHGRVSASDLPFHTRS